MNCKTICFSDAVGREISALCEATGIVVRGGLDALLIIEDGVATFMPTERLRSWGKHAAPIFSEAMVVEGLEEDIVTGKVVDISFAAKTARLDPTGIIWDTIVHVSLTEAQVQALKEML